MTVQELIEALAKYPSDLVVVLPTYNQNVTPSFNVVQPGMLTSARTEVNAYGDVTTGLRMKDDWIEGEEGCSYPGDNCVVISAY